MRRVLYCLGFLLFPLTAQADDICTAIATDSKVEAHFAETRTKELKTGDKRLYVDGSRNSGTCHSDGVWLESAGTPPKEYTYQCSYNGCGFGSTASIVHWKGDFYILTELRDFGDFEKLLGWDKLSSQEQAKIKFRNLTAELYKIAPKTNSATSLCEEYNLLGRRPVQERMVYGDKACLLLMNVQVKSLFPASLRDEEHFKDVTLIPDKFAPNISLRIDGYHIDLNRKVMVDLNKDGKKETIVPVEGNSGAGCGCDVESVTLLNEKDEPLKPQDDFSNRFISFTQSLNCGEKLDIIADKGRYYFEKKTRSGTREFFRISPDSYAPACIYVNEAPLPWYSK